MIDKCSCCIIEVARAFDLLHQSNLKDDTTSSCSTPERCKGCVAATKESVRHRSVEDQPPFRGPIKQQNKPHVSPLRAKTIDTHTLASELAIQCKPFRISNRPTRRLSSISTAPSRVHCITSHRLASQLRLSPINSNHVRAALESMQYARDRARV